MVRLTNVTIDDYLYSIMTEKHYSYFPKMINQIVKVLCLQMTSMMEKSVFLNCKILVYHNFPCESKTCYPIKHLWQKHVQRTKEFHREEY